MDICDWFVQHAKTIDYNEVGRTSSRQTFIDSLREALGNETNIYIYLTDNINNSTVDLILYYESVMDSTRLYPRKVRVAKHLIDNVKRGLVSLAELMPNQEARVSAWATLLKQKYKDSEVEADNVIGIAIVDGVNFAKYSHSERNIFNLIWMHFSHEIIRSRANRHTAAMNSVIRRISGDYNIVDIINILKKSTRSTKVEILEISGDHYKSIKFNDYGSSATHSDLNLNCNILSKLIFSNERQSILRSQYASIERDLEYVGLISNNSKWMTVTCHADGILIKDRKKINFIQYVFICERTNVEESNAELYTMTDANIALNIISVLKNSLPYYNLTARLNQLSEKLSDFMATSNGTLSKSNRRICEKLFQICSPYLSSLISIEYAERDLDGDFFPVGFVKMGSISIDDVLDSPNRRRSISFFDENNNECSGITLSISTEYNMNRAFILFFSGPIQPYSYLQYIDLIEDSVRNIFHIVDFWEFQLETQAEVAHVVRADLSAAKREIEALYEKVETYERLPTLLAEQLRSPEMQDAKNDVIHWLTEASALVDAPRYLLGSFDETSIRWSDVNIHSLIKSVIKICSGEARRRRIRVSIESKDIETLIISADTQLIKIVLYNLIDNAIKYSYESRNIYVYANVNNGSFNFEIIDYGVFLPSSDRDKIFMPWARSPRTSAILRRPGTGLGLAVSQRILKAHDEDAILDYSSDLISKDLGKTTFYFSFRLKGKGSQ